MITVNAAYVFGGVCFVGGILIARAINSIDKRKRRDITDFYKSLPEHSKVNFYWYFIRNESEYLNKALLTMSRDQVDQYQSFTVYQYNTFRELVIFYENTIK